MKEATLPPGQVMTLLEAARYLRVSDKTLGEMARSSRIPCQRVGREWRFLRSALEAWLSAGRMGTVKARRTTRKASPELRDSKSGFCDTAFTKNRAEPVHRWVPWIAGFSSEFVRSAVARFTEPGATVLDPFAGVGTTLFEAVANGRRAVGFEINPYAVLTCKVKLMAFGLDVASLRRAAVLFADYMDAAVRDTSVQPVSTPPIGFRSRVPFFSPPIERQVLLVLDYINRLTSPLIHDVFRLALGAVMVSVSNYTYEPSLGTRAGAGKPNIDEADVCRVLAEKLEEITCDISHIQRATRGVRNLPPRAIHLASYLTEAELLADTRADLLVTSPPYLNNYHYVRNTRPHLYWLGLVDGQRQLKSLEHQSFGKFWQTVRGDKPPKLTFECPDLEHVLSEVANRNSHKGVYGGQGWANYATHYFNDCCRFLETTARVMKPGAPVVVVIGNSILQGIELRTDDFLIRIAKMLGYALEGRQIVREKRTGTSVVNSSVRSGKVSGKSGLYEVAVVLRTPNGQ